MLTVLAPVLILVLLRGCLYSAYLGFTEVEQATHVEDVSWLPEEASDICYYRSYSFTAYEFDISEPGFRAWAEGWDLKPIEGRFSLWRYTFMLDREPPPYPSESASDEELDEYADQYQAWRDAQEATITEGYCYAYEQSNGGGVRVAYDAEKGRAYYQSSPR